MLGINSKFTFRINSAPTNLYLWYLNHPGPSWHSTKQLEPSPAWGVKARTTKKTWVEGAPQAEAVCGAYKKLPGWHLGSGGAGLAGRCWLPHRLKGPQ